MSEPCATCGTVQLASPSTYFCSDSCQQRWHERRAIPIVSNHSPTVPAQLANAVTRWQT
ncbi:hypothetical protein [Solihabitans fulvus]|uniref:hypothetical protein n=1 Tax=Solihabitans fulvus TaxID=1892852 RepID=UPI001661AFBD|nr:hypothetical protein [Solihabitans fulvus]